MAHLDDSQKKQEQALLLQIARRRYIESVVLAGPWITAYDQSGEFLSSLSHFCALIPKSARKQVLSTLGWDLLIGHGVPSVWVGGGKIGYSRLGLDNDIEPFVHYRSFHGIRPSYVEVIEEFRLYHNLYYDRPKNAHIFIDEDGNEENAVLIEQDKLRVKLHLLTKFLSVKQKDFVIFFQGDYSSRHPLEDVDLKPGETQEKTSRHVIALNVSNDTSCCLNGTKSWSRLMGKIILPCPTKSVPDPFERKKSRTYPKFIIGIDRRGNPVRHTCDPEQLNNMFGKNPGQPNYLTPVQFRREVLQKYYDNPHKFEVVDGSVQCKGLWSMRVDNDSSGPIVAWLGDLGRDLSDNERQHWLQYNIAPEGGVSETFYRRQIMGQFFDPQMPDLVFKRRYDSVNESWLKKRGWPLFLPMHDEDAHLIQTVHVPTGNNQSEFENQILTLTKLLVDSLNESEIQKGLTSLKKEDRGLNKLSKFFAENAVVGYEPHIKFLKNLQNLRSAGTAHRKGKNYTAAAAAFKLGQIEIKTVGFGILQQANDFLQFVDTST